MLSKQEKTKIIEANRINDVDTGSANVQVAVLAERIKMITEHLKQFPKDKHSRRGLEQLLGKRRSFEKYLAKNQK